MKNIRKILAALMALMLVLTALPCAWAEAPEKVLKLATSAGAGAWTPPVSPSTCHAVQLLLRVLL